MGSGPGSTSHFLMDLIAFRSCTCPFLPMTRQRLISPRSQCRAAAENCAVAHVMAGSRAMPKVMSWRKVVL